MNNREKEVLQYSLDNEKAVIEELKSIYSQAYDDIGEKIKALMADELTQSKIYQIEYQKALKGQVSAILDNLNSEQYDSISEYLRECYEDGFIGTLYSLHGYGIPLIIPINQEQVVDALILDSKISEKLYTKLGNNVKELKKAISHEISRGISTSMSYHDIARNLRSRGKMTENQSMRIVRTEGNRIYNEASYNAAIKAKENGADIVKVWDSTLDGKTRPHHRQLDGQVRKIEEYFEIGGASALYPVSFGVASEDCNCRCVALVKPRWDVDGSFTKRNNETGELMEFVDVKGYEEFKEKYWEAVDKSAESGIIKAGSEEMYRKKNTGKIEPMPKKQLRKIEKSFKAKGGIIQSNAETDAYLDSKNAEAITYDAFTILLKQNPGRASVFEELIHATQYRNGENDGSYISRLKCEISAQKKLIKNANAYKLTDNEVIQTKKALQMYEQELNEYIKNGGA